MDTQRSPGRDRGEVTEPELDNGQAPTLPTAGKKMLFAIQPPSNWEEMSRDEKLDWCQEIADQITVPRER
jgi:hypothetical protein